MTLPQVKHRTGIIMVDEVGRWSTNAAAAKRQRTSVSDAFTIDVEQAGGNDRRQRPPVDVDVISHVTLNLSTIPVTPAKTMSVHT